MSVALALLSSHIHFEVVSSEIISDNSVLNLVASFLTFQVMYPYTSITMKSFLHLKPFFEVNHLFLFVLKASQYPGRALPPRAADVCQGAKK